jgi:hypothetical protein
MDFHQAEGPVGVRRYVNPTITAPPDSTLMWLLRCIMLQSTYPITLCSSNAEPYDPEGVFDREG